MSAGPRPDFFIVGAPKCGTSALWTYLRQHPEIFMSKLKEPHFFGSDLFERVPRPTPTLEDYVAHFAGAGAAKRVGEASTTYLVSRRAAAEIKAFSPSASILILLRDPVEVMRSMHADLVYWGNEDLEDFEAALEAEPMRRRGLRLPPNPGLPARLLYREVASFVEQVRRYFEVFGRERVYVILSDELRSTPLEVYRGTLRFLGVHEDFRPDLRPVNENKAPRSRGVERWLARPPRLVSRLAGSVLSRRARGVIYHRLRELNTRRGVRPPFDPQLRERLRAEFAPEVARLGELIGRDLSRWSRRG